MGYPVYQIPVGQVLPIMFDTYAGSTGASITLTGLAVTDIEVYKNGSATQRASDAGFALLDTDGIDFDGITGIHGFSIDTGDNTDSGFYTVGAWFHVVVSSITVDGQTVSFVAAAFRLMAAEGVAGVPDVNVTHVSDTAQTAGDLIADTNDIQSRLPAALVSGRIDASVGAMAANVMTAAAAASDLTTELQAGLATSADVATVAGYIDTEVAAIKVVTDRLGTMIENTSDGWIWTVASLQQAPAGGSGLDAAGVRAAIGMASANLDDQLAALPTAAENATAVMGSTVEGSFDLTESARLWNAALAGKASGLAGSAATFRDLADSKDRIVATVDADGNRTAVTRDVT